MERGFMQSTALPAHNAVSRLKNSAITELNIHLILASAALPLPIKATVEWVGRGKAPVYLQIGMLASLISVWSCFSVQVHLEETFACLCLRLQAPPENKFFKYSISEWVCAKGHFCSRMIKHLQQRETLSGHQKPSCMLVKDHHVGLLCFPKSQIPKLFLILYSRNK